MEVKGRFHNTKESRLKLTQYLLENISKKNDVNVLQNSKPAIRTNVRRLIMIYDYLKWGNKRTS